jgi:hypothetical protein
MSWLFLFFCISGFCSILYEIIWLPLAMASFGVTSALVSIVLSVFMAGLGLGSWGSGHLIRRFSQKLKSSALILYALSELFIGVSAILVPYELTLGRPRLERLGVSSSAGYYAASAFWVRLSLIPWCACMGATIPFAMLAIRSRDAGQSQRSFSYLYGGILRQWLPSGDRQVHAAIARALQDSFPNVRAFQGVTKYGADFLASDRPIPRSPAELARQMSRAAVDDMLEWGPAMPDDRPVNEYFLPRLLKRGSQGSETTAAEITH